MKSSRSLVALALAGSLALVGCASDKSESGGASGGPGVSEDAIALGVLTDQSGPFVELGTGVVNGHEIWVEEINANGGVCDRQIELITRDSGYDADTGVVQYQEVEPQVLGFMQILGSPINAALDQQYEANETTVVALSWSSFILENPYIIIPGTTYDVEMINGLSFLLEEGQISEGDTIGYIYLEGEYGENGLLGAEYFAEQHDITLETVKVLPTDTDLRNVVTGLRGEGVKAIGLTTTPAQTLSAATVSAQLGLNVPLVGNNPTFSPQILTKQTAAALKNFYLVASATPYSSDVEAAKKVAEAYEASGAEAAPNGGIPYGYAIGELWGQLLEKTCDDLTREGVKAALDESDSIDTDRLIAELDFSEPGAPATREVYIGVADMSTPGGIRQQGDLFVSEDAETYTAPAEEG